MNNHFNKRGRNNHQRRRQGVNPNRALDSNGPDVRIRGTAQQIYDKYLALARDASSSGDRVKAENYFQHAEHYFRVLRAVQGPQAQPSDQSQDGDFDGGDQPAVGESPRDFREHPRDQRDFREQRQPQSQPAIASDEREPSSSEEQPFEAAPNGAEESVGADQRAQEGQGRGDFEGRRRRRRPRRPREEGGAAEAPDAAPEPVGAE